MTITHFYIETDNPIRSYFSGQSVSGKVIVNAHEESKIKGISVIFMGRATVLWEDKREIIDRDGDKRKVNKTYWAEEEYLNNKINLEGNKTITGRSEYPFNIELPCDLPSSFIGLHGKVDYYIEAILKRSWKSDRKAMMPFTVNAIVDLNKNEKSQLPIEIKMQKHVCCLCCRSGPIGIVFNMTRMGYVSGEAIEINAEVFNHSTTKVLPPNLKLYQRIEYHARSKYRSETRILNAVVGPFVDRGESEPWVGSVLQIPPVPASTLGKGSIISVSYNLVIEMKITGTSRNLRKEIPIIIGTIPLRATFQRYQFHANENPEPENIKIKDKSQPQSTNTIFSGSPLIPLPSAPAFDEYPDLPPPTYAEAAHIGNNENSIGKSTSKGFGEENLTTMSYTPKYITYGWTTQLN